MKKRITPLGSTTETLGTHSKSSAGAAAGKVSSRLSQLGLPAFEANRVGNHEAAHLSEATGICAVAIIATMARIDIVENEKILISLIVLIPQVAFVQPLYEPSGEEMYKMAMAPHKIGDRPSTQDGKVAQKGLQLWRAEEAQQKKEEAQKEAEEEIHNKWIEMLTQTSEENQDISNPLIDEPTEESTDFVDATQSTPQDNQNSTWDQSPEPETENPEQKTIPVENTVFDRTQKPAEIKNHP